MLEGVELITYKGKIYVPLALRHSTIEWYHYFMNHPGRERLYKTLATICYWKGISTQCNTYCRRCHVCQKFKSQKRKYGHLPPRNVEPQVPWNTVHVDLVGPYSLMAKQSQPQGDIKNVELRLTCMTMIDPVTGWFEIAEVPNYIVNDLVNQTTQENVDKSSARISRIFDQVWLS